MHTWKGAQHLFEVNFQQKISQKLHISGDFDAKNQTKTTVLDSSVHPILLSVMLMYTDKGILSKLNRRWKLLVRTIL